MKVTFTKIIYEDYEVDVPFEEYENRFDESKEEMVLEYMHNAIKVHEKIELDDIELGKLDDEDAKYQEDQYKQWQYEAMLEELDYRESVL